MNRGHDRERIFVDDDDRGHFLGLLAHLPGTLGIRLEAGMVTEPWQYAWSSCRAYASGAADPLLAETRTTASGATTTAVASGVGVSSSCKRTRRRPRSGEQAGPSVRNHPGHNWRDTEVEPYATAAAGRPTPDGRRPAFRRNSLLKNN